MKITETKIKVSDLVENYKDNGDGGVFGYNDRLTIRPSFQREFIYGEKQRAAVIDSVMNGFPLNVMYWSKTGSDSYEVLDGQQRTVSIAQYINKDFPIKINGNDKFFQNLTDEEKQTILDYELTVYVCEGTEAEKLEWFKRINIAGEVLTPQELLNATYTGPWLADAKNYFSKRNCVAAKMADGYLKGNPIRQELLPLMTICRCCARNVILRSRISDVLQLLTGWTFLVERLQQISFWKSAKDTTGQIELKKFLC